MNFSKEEEEAIYHLAEKLTGSSQKGDSRKSILVQNVMRRVRALNCKGLAQYLDFALKNKDEHQQLLSALTIHHTNWFREADVFPQLCEEITRGRSSTEPLRILCAACSTGEEVYSLGLFLEFLRLRKPELDYRIVGVDIDPVSVQTSKKAIYKKERARDIPLSYHSLLNFGTGPTEGFFTLDRDIRKRTSFHAGDLRAVKNLMREKQEGLFDAILCRNVLIYFDKQGVDRVVEHLVSLLGPESLLCVGHSESIDGRVHGLIARGRSLYRRPLASTDAQGPQKSGRILVVDDSLVIRKMLMSTLSQAGFAVEAVESAHSANKALSERAFDLITLDLHMPEVDGIVWLREQRLAGLKTPVVIVSDASPAEADDVLGILATHAQEYFEKKNLRDNPQSLIDCIKAIVAQQRMESPKIEKNTRKQGVSVKKFLPDVIVIGASTGGTEALVKVLGSMPLQCPPIIVVQHITPAFAQAFAARLARVAGLTLGKPIQDVELQRGHLYMALGDYHIGLRRLGGKIKLELSYAAPEHSMRPAVDFLFRSAVGSRVKALGCLLTGMGKDGAVGLLELKNSGSYTMAQDESSCVVYGMPQEAARIGAVQFVGNLRELRQELDDFLQAAPQAA